MGVLNENTNKALTEYAEDVVKFSRINIGMKKKYKRSSGRFTNGRIDWTGTLRNSLDYTVKQSKNSFVVNIEAKGNASKYADVVEDGRKKGKGIPIGELEKWIRKKVRMRKDGKNVKKTDRNVLQMAIAISNNAKKNGIPGKHYMRDANDMALKKHEALIKEGIIKDVESMYSQLLESLSKSNTR